MRNKRNRKKTTKNFNIYHSIELILLILIIFVLIVFVYGLSSRNNNTVTPETILAETSENTENKIAEEENNAITENTETAEPVEETADDITFTMAVTGDIMCHNTMYNDAYDSSSKTYDFSYYFDDVKYYLQTADITIGNLETTFAGSSVGYSSYPTFNTPESLATALKKAGFDVVSTANNHCLDKGYNGITSTIKYLDEADISHTGTYTSEEDQQTILIKNVKGVSIAFLSFTYGTNGISIPKGKEYCVNLNDKETMLEQLKLAQEQNPDMICVSMHWGTEYQTTPNSTQKELADFLFENGADIILGNHPHVIQPMEKRTITLDDGTTKEGFIIYSLGNFMADQSYKYTRDSAIVKLEIKKDGATNAISINDVTYTPTYVYKNPFVSSKKFKILDIEQTIESYDAGYDTTIGKSNYTTLVTELKNIKSLLSYN